MFSFFSKKAPRAEDKRQTTAPLKKGWIPVSEVRIGMFISELDRPWEDTPFMFQRFSVDSENDLKLVRSVCERVYVEYTTAAVRQKPRQITPLELSREIERSEDVLDAAHQATDSMFEELRLSGSIDTGVVHKVVDDCIDAVLRNSDAISWLAQIRKHDRGLAQHALNTVTLAVMLGNKERLRPNELHDLGTCALLHDVGKIRLTKDNAPGSQTDGKASAQRQRHCAEGRNILLSTRSLYSGAADVAFSHHEHVDGSGFPRGLSADQIPLYAKLVAIANAYDNALHGADGRRANATQAMRLMYAERDRRFDATLVMQFIASMGVYPPGSIVEMESGEVGLVLSNNSGDRLHPRVIVVLDASKRAIRQYVVDLSQQAARDGVASLQIGRTLDDGSYGINTQDFVRAGLNIDIEHSTP